MKMPIPIPPGSESVTVEPLAYIVAGTGPPLLLIHGAFANGQSSWNIQLKTLPEHHRLLVVDRRGHGASPREPRPYTIAGDATDVLKVADLAATATFHLVGHSYGGLVAIEIARRAPQRIRSLHLIEPPYLSLLAGEPDVGALTRQSQVIFQHARAWAPERIAAAFFELILGPDGLAELQTHQSWCDIVREASRGADEEFTGAYSPGALDDLRLGAPVRVYTGTRSHPVHQKIARRLAESIRGAHLVEVPEATYAVQRCVEPFHQVLIAVTIAEPGTR